MIKIVCDRCDQEITEPTEISTVVEEGGAKHYHTSDCFTEARDRLSVPIVRQTEPA